MKRAFLTLASMTALLLSGCSTTDNLSPEAEEQARKGPAPYSPDPAANLPQFYDPTGRL